MTKHEPKCHIAKTVRAALLALAAEYGRCADVPLSTVSKRFYGNANFFRELKRDKRSISIHKADEIIAKFREQWPAGAVWPDILVQMGIAAD